MEACRLLLIYDQTAWTIKVAEPMKVHILLLTILWVNDVEEGDPKFDPPTIDPFKNIFLVLLS